MEWRNELSTGNDLLDGEDKEIIRLLNMLLEYRDVSAESNSKFSQLLSTLRIEIAHHFIEEERLMEQNGCPNPKLIEHIKDHILMLLTLAETRYISKEEILYRTIPYLSDKLTSHMTTIDRECIPYLAN